MAKHSVSMFLKKLPLLIWCRIKRKYTRLKINALSMFYNEHLGSSYVADILMEPIFWFVDNFTVFLGPLFVVSVICLTASVVIICILIGLPYWIQRSVGTTVFILFTGLWLLFNVLFHYYMGCVVHPGLPPRRAFIQEAVSICKKCIAPKPPRTHHCSVCNKCILKMDHHCPWLNNCVGFHNHRHFFLYMVYTTLGVFYIMCFGIELFLERVWWHEDELEGYPVGQNGSAIEEELIHENPATESPFPKWHRGALVYMAFIVVGVFLSLGSLTIWHARLISRGETSIENHINKAEEKRYAKRGERYVNPYNLGSKRNWSIFFGVEGLTFAETILRVLLPSRHSIRGDGLTWISLFSENDFIITYKTE